MERRQWDICAREIKRSLLELKISCIVIDQDSGSVVQLAGFGAGFGVAVQVIP